MKKFTHRLSASVIATAAASSAVIAMTATGASAADFNLAGGPEANFVGSGVSFTDVQAEQTLTCEQFDLKGTATPGAYDFGSDVGSLDELVSSGCENDIAGPTTVDPTGVWGVAIDGPGATATEWDARLTTVTAFVSAAGCSFDVGGEVSGTFNETTQVFTPTSSTLEIVTTPSGFLCGLLGVSLGDDITVAGSWTNVPPAGSSPLSIS